MDRIGSRYLESLGTARNTKDISLVAESTAHTATGQTSGQDVSTYGEALLLIDVTAVAGTSPTCQFYVDTYDNQSAKWFQLPVTISSVTAVSQVVVPLTNFGEQIRLRYTLGGTSPSFTFGANVIAKS